MSYAVPQDFNPALFMYLNPEIVVGAGVSNASGAVEWARSNDVSGFIYSLSTLPTGFDSRVFLVAAKDSANVSPLNAEIYNAMLSEGLGAEEIENRGAYIENIYRNAKHMGCNVFEVFNPPGSGSNLTFVLSSNAVGVGDIIMMKGAGKVTKEYAIVTDVDYSERTLTLSNFRRPFAGAGSDYVLYGIKVYDIERLAAINFIRGTRNGAGSNIPLEAAAFLDGTFNPDLYRLLYPKARNMNDAQAYMDYVGETSNNNPPIGKVQDIIDVGFLGGGGSNLLFTIPANNVSITYQLRLPESTSSFVFKGVTVYGISQDDEIKSKMLEPASAEAKLITEYAIKKYIDRSYEEKAEFNDVDINGKLRMLGEVQFSQSTVFDFPTANVGHLTVTCNMDAPAGNVWIGGCNNVFSNIEVFGSTFYDALDVNTDLHANSNVYVCGSVYGPRIGIGPVDGTGGPLSGSDSWSNAGGRGSLTLKDLSVTDMAVIGTSNTYGSNVLIVNGNIVADNVNNTSDRRVKYNVREIDAEDALEKINSLRAVSYRMRTNGDVTERHYAGFLADDLENVLPDVVTNGGDRVVPMNISAKLRVSKSGRIIVKLGVSETFKLHKGDVLAIGTKERLIVAGDGPGENEFVVNDIDDMHRYMGDDIVITECVLKDVKSVNYSSLLGWVVAAIQALARERDI